MGSFSKLVDAIFVLFFFIIAVAAPLIDGQTILPLHLYPTILVDLKTWYVKEYGDYLVSEKPHFFVGIVWLELLFQWPLALTCIYGILSSKPWSNTTCLIYGASTFTCMAVILAELTGSRRASDKLLIMYFPFMAFAVLAILRGLLTHSSKTAVIVCLYKSCVLLRSGNEQNGFIKVVDLLLISWDVVCIAKFANLFMQVPRNCCLLCEIIAMVKSPKHCILAEVIFNRYVSMW